MAMCVSGEKARIFALNEFVKRFRFSQSRHVAVIGAGIIGVTTAIQLLRRGHRVDIFAKDLDPVNPRGVQPIASTAAGAFWLPFLLEAPTRVMSDLMDLAVETYLTWKRYAHEFPTAIRKQKIVILDDINKPEFAWIHVPIHGKKYTLKQWLERKDTAELQVLPTGGWEMQTYTFDTPVLMPRLLELARRHGARFNKQDIRGESEPKDDRTTLTDLAKFYGQQCGAVVNCTGAGGW